MIFAERAPTVSTVLDPRDGVCTAIIIFGFVVVVGAVDLVDDR